jgi:hypothetical protein
VTEVLDRPTVTETAVLREPEQAASLTGDGERLRLAGGKHADLKFTVRNIIRIELAFKSHAEFLVELSTMPLATLAWVLINLCEVVDIDAAMPLLEGADWSVLQKQVRQAWERAMPPAEPSDGADRPTAGS